MCTSGGKPVGTTREGFWYWWARLLDYQVGKHIDFRGIDLPDKWDTSNNLIPDYWNAVPNVLCNRDVLTRSQQQTLCAGSVEESSEQLSIDHMHSL